MKRRIQDGLNDIPSDPLSGQGQSATPIRTSPDGRAAEGRDQMENDGKEPQPDQGDAKVNQIRQRAYEIYLRRGQGQGLELEDWLQAEAEVCEIDRDEQAA